MVSSSHFSFRSAGGARVSTCHSDGSPRDWYKYLGVYVYSSEPERRLDQFILNKIEGFFTTLSPLALTHSELIRLVNCQLIPILTYRLMAHNFPPEVISFYERAIWSKLCAHSRLSELVSGKDRAVRRRDGGLCLNSLQLSVYESVYHTALRHLGAEGPDRANRAVMDCLMSSSPTLVLDVFVDSAQALGVRIHG